MGSKELLEEGIRQNKFRLDEKDGFKRESKEKQKLSEEIKVAYEAIEKLVDGKVEEILGYDGKKIGKEKNKYVVEPREGEI